MREEHGREWVAPTRPPIAGTTSSPPTRRVRDSTESLPDLEPTAGRLALVVALLWFGVALVSAVLVTGIILRSGLGGAPEARESAFDQTERVELVARAQISTVRVAARACPGVVGGSGFVVDGLLFTSAHLVRFDDSLKVDRPGQPVFAPVIATSTSLDIAVADGEDLVAVDLTMADALAPVNERVVMSGFPDGNEIEISEATVVGYQPAANWGVQGEQVMLIDPGTRAGFSGGPVLDRDGRVVGMLAGVDETTGLAIAIPADELADVVELASATWAGGGGSTTHAAIPCE